MKNKFNLRFLFILFLITGYSTRAQTHTWDGEAGDGLWSSATNWNPNTVPGAGNHVLIAGGATVNLDVDATVAGIHSLGISGASGGTLIIDAGVTLTTTNRGIFIRHASSSFEINGTYDVTHADTNYSGIRNDGGGTVTINTGGMVTMDDIVGGYGIYSTASGTMTNNGTLTISNLAGAQDGINIISGTLSNNGELSFSDITGLFALRGGITNSSTGSITGTGANSSGTILNDVTIAGGTISPNGSSAIGQASFRSSLNITGPTSFAGQIANNSGTLTSDEIYFFNGGSANFDISDLDVSITDIGGTSLALGNTFTIVDSQFGYTGTFNSIDTSAPTLPASTGWQVNYNTNTVTIEIIATLPVELRYFIGFSDDDRIRLNWQTDTEINNDYFEVERSNNLASWEKIAQIEGNGTTTRTINYSHSDRRPSSGSNYYRLKQVDYDGQFEYHKIIHVPFHIAEQQNVFPNPSDGNIRLTNRLLNPDEPAKIFSLNGQLLTAQKVIDQRIDLTSLPRGTYILKVQNSSLRISIE